ncbi:MAG: ATP-dependent helicase [Methanomassiliicoccaceae archaeon]|nr:ATP-dependent helicase [Methanomassiliicoccaceae archaeon]
MKPIDAELSLQQLDIVTNTSGNIVVSASAGTGKTRTMIAKIMQDLSENRTHKVIAAITFTRKATQEIRDRLTFDSSQCFIGTNNNFATDEVIKPFMKDVYGESFDIEMDTDYANKNRELKDFDEGVKSIEEYHTIYSYKNVKKNFVFDLALDILKKSVACRLYLQAKYCAIYIDEYQDCDIDMHNFLMHISDDLKIKTFIVGDDKQSIFQWKGAYPEVFKSIFVKENFTHKKLTMNHRSDKQIQDYSNLIFEETHPLVVNPQNCGNIIWIKATYDNWAGKVISLLDSEKTSALLRHTNTNAKTGADLLTKEGLEHIFIPKIPIENITTNTAWIYYAIASFVLLDTYSAYNFLNDIPVESDAFRVKEIKKILNDIKQNAESANQNAFNQSVNMLSGYLGYTTPKEHIDELYKTVTDKKFAVALNPERPRHCALTIHTSKGLEFEQVIIFIEDFAHNRELKEEHSKNHYVACTRAESKLIIVDTNIAGARTAQNRLLEMFYKAGIDPDKLISMQ